MYKVTINGEGSCKCDEYVECDGILKLYKGKNTTYTDKHQWFKLYKICDGDVISVEEV